MIIRAVGLSKQYKPPRSSTPIRDMLHGKTKKDPVLAVDGIDFSIGRGEFVGFLGPNGAGKSTTIKMLTGLLLPTAGTVSVLSRDPFAKRRENSGHIGVMFGQRSQLWWDLPISDVFGLHKKLYAIPDDAYSEQSTALRRLLEIDEFVNTPVRQLSLGQRMRGELGLAMLHNPEILFLDEPTIGMDVMVKERIRAFLSEINREKGTTILLTTHDLEEIRRSTQRILVINHGRLLFDGPMDRLREQCADDVTVKLQIDGDIPTGFIPMLRDLRYEDGHRITFRVNRKAGEMALLGELIRDVMVRDIVIEEPPIEALVRDLYGEAAVK